ncbi:MAG TPA: glycosyltransferase family 39 protein [Thermoanaerobaculia bacterium]|nr:glycosyltransferase family 39 protein [Thermoanaerobaculia bacterium]
MKRAVLIALLLVGAIRIASTYTTFSETADEPMHLAAGLQILTHQTYWLQLQNPPLPRLLIALPPYLAGARWDGTSGDPIKEAIATFYTTGHYKTLLVLGRVGTLVFFVIGALATWAWVRRESDELTALVALLFFTTQPSILGHSGLATLDTPGVAGMAVALLAFSRWVERPTLARAAVLGVAWGFSINCKLLCLAYVPIACAAIYAVRLARDEQTRARWRSIYTVAVVPPLAALLIWAGYGFSFNADTLVPAPAFVEGIAQMIEVNRAGFPSYALTRWSNEGWWWYFPLALALKTTIATLLLFVCGFFFARRNAVFFEAAAAALAILGWSMTTHVNIGIRYILPIYVPLSFAAAITVRQFLGFLGSSGSSGETADVQPLRRTPRYPEVLRGTVFVLLAWHLIASFAAHPDYLAYFNEAAVRDPSYYLIDSNLDWGQDVLRLRNEVRRLKIPALGVALFGPPDLDKLGFPPHHWVDPMTPTTGWVAVSDGVYRWGRPFGGYAWLARADCRRIGKSIRLCHMQ